MVLCSPEARGERCEEANQPRGVRREPAADRPTIYCGAKKRAESDQEEAEEEEDDDDEEEERGGR